MDVGWVPCVLEEPQASSRSQASRSCMGDGKLWWFVVVTRGVVKLHVMGEDFQQTGGGMAKFVRVLPGILKGVLPGATRLPRVVMTDRGPGLYHTSRVVIVEAYRKALEDEGLTPFAGVDGNWQPPDLADLLMHETVAAWVRMFFMKKPLA